MRCSNTSRVSTQGLRFDGGGTAHVTYKGKIGRLEERIELMLQKAMAEKEEQFLKLGQSLG